MDSWLKRNGTEPGGATNHHRFSLDQAGQERGPGVKYRDCRTGAFGQHHQGRFGVLVGPAGVIPVIEHLRNRAQQKRGDDDYDERSHVPVPHGEHSSLRLAGGARAGKPKQFVF